MVYTTPSTERHGPELFSNGVRDGFRLPLFVLTVATAFTQRAFVALCCPRRSLIWTEFEGFMAVFERGGPSAGLGS